MGFGRDQYLEPPSTTANHNQDIHNGQLQQDGYHE
jgi:hypothetical protein